MLRPLQYQKYPTQSGFALLIVLWIIAIMALLGSAVVGQSRIKVRIASNLRNAAYCEAAADGAVAHAIFQLLARQWVRNGTYEINIGSALVNLLLQDEATKINPNRATWGTLRGLLMRIGVDETSSTRLAKSIVDYRNRETTSLHGGQTLTDYIDSGLPYGPSHRPFGSLDEMGLVIGMTPKLLTLIKPYLSIYQDEVTQQDVGETETGSSSGVTPPSRFVAQAFGDRSLMVKVIAKATMKGGARFVREAVIRFKGRLMPQERPYQILTWETSSD